jgi:hypothetical protein
MIHFLVSSLIKPTPHEPPTEAENSEIRKLSRAGNRLMGFCRTNLFKRLESGGPAFIQSRFSADDGALSGLQAANMDV